jgi:hypothetical protein
VLIPLLPQDKQLTIVARAPPGKRHGLATKDARRPARFLQRFALNHYTLF